MSSSSDGDGAGFFGGAAGDSAGEEDFGGGEDGLEGGGDGDSVGGDGGSEGGETVVGDDLADEEETPRKRKRNALRSVQYLNVSRTSPSIVDN